jgi:hypothetical protein
MMDYVMDRDNKDGTITRYFNNYELLIVYDKIVNIKYDINLIPIKKKENKNTSFIENPNIGVIDTETLECNDGVYRIYCLGFKTYLAKDPVIFYIKDKDYGSYNDIVLNLVNECIEL